jgi:hypothetical protein
MWSKWPFPDFIRFRQTYPGPRMLVGEPGRNGRADPSHEHAENLKAGKSSPSWGPGSPGAGTSPIVPLASVGLGSCGHPHDSINSPETHRACCLSCILLCVLLTPVHIQMEKTPSLIRTQVQKDTYTIVRVSLVCFQDIYFPRRRKCVYPFRQFFIPSQSLPISPNTLI